MKVTAFNKQTCRDMVDDFTNLLKEFERTWGVRVEYQGGKFDAHRFNPKIEITIAGENGEKVYAREAQDWQRYAAGAGLNVEWLGKTVRAKNKDLTIIGWAASRHAKPIMLKDSIGRVYFAPITITKQLTAGARKF